MKILIVGSGGREHALLWKLARDAPEADFFTARGNAGTRGLARQIPLEPTDIPALATWAERERIDLTVVGPEAALAGGIVDSFKRHGLAIFGPTLAAASIETSKSFAKNLMRRAGVPTAEYSTFNDLPSAERHLRERGAPIVVKASGLAAGKGAVVCHTVDDALEAARGMLRHHVFGTAGQEIVVEEFMEGEEVSVFAITDGTDALTLATAQDYKRIGEGDTGPNTGGMGATAPVTSVDAELEQQIRERILIPTLNALRAAGRPYRGLLYAGLMLTAEGPKVVEFNARFGDPETQALLPLLESSLLDPILAVAGGKRVPKQPLIWREGYGWTIVLASAGYPGRPELGKEMTIPDSVADADDLLLFHAGTRVVGDRLATSGGRVLAVTALAATPQAAAERARAAADAISFEGKQYRRDIGWRELAKHGVAANHTET